MISVIRQVFWGAGMSLLLAGGTACSPGSDPATESAAVE